MALGQDIAPLSLDVHLPAFTAASMNQPVGALGRRARIESVGLVAATTITGHTTNYSTLSLINRGTDGSGTTVVATLAFTSGVDAAAGVLKDLTLSPTKANLEIGADDILALTWVEAGTGLDLPASLVSIKYGDGYGGGI